jgi:hypothetical protein
VAALCLHEGSTAAGTRHPPLSGGSSCVTRQCHALLLEAATGAGERSIHQPAAEGGCASCHDLARAAGARFVKGAPAIGDEGPEKARAWDLALCIGCHGERLLASNASAATGFADGTRNLHALHVQSGRGLRCLPCHDPHAARQPRLLRERIPARGNAQITQEFRGEMKGGWCKSRCHAPKSYQR